jgi:outer membrane receptor protein involved in Fe transport
MKGLFSFAAYDVALYNTNVSNENVPYRGGRFYFSAGSVRRQGAELSASLLGSDDLEISGSVTLSRNRYLEYAVDSVHYGVPGRLADYSGNRVAGVPSQYYSASLRRAVALSIPLVAHVSVRGVGKHYVDDANNVSVPAWRTYGAGIRTSSVLPLGRLALSAFMTVDNIADTRYIGSAFVNPDIVDGVPVAFEPGAGRTLLLSVSVRAR